MALLNINHITDSFDVFVIVGYIAYAFGRDIHLYIFTVGGVGGGVGGGGVGVGWVGGGVIYRMTKSIFLKKN